MSTMASQITSLTIVYSTIYSGADQRKHQSSASLTFVRGIQRWPVNSPHKGPVTRKMFPFDDVIMVIVIFSAVSHHAWHHSGCTHLGILCGHNQVEAHRQFWRVSSSWTWIWNSSNLTMQTMIFRFWYEYSWNNLNIQIESRFRILPFWRDFVAKLGHNKGGGGGGGGGYPISCHKK